MVPNTDFINVGHFWIQRIFQKTSLQILSDSGGVMMRFGTKIFISKAYVYSQILRLHANCAYTFSNVTENHPQNTSEKFSYTSTSLTLQISHPLIFSAHEGSYHVRPLYIVLFTNYYFNSSIQRAPRTCTLKPHAHTQTPARAHTKSEVIWHLVVNSCTSAPLCAITNDSDFWANFKFGHLQAATHRVLTELMLSTQAFPRHMMPISLRLF